MQLVLAIETSCDETAAAVVNGDGKILSNVIASQMDIHARYGGVVPEIASRNHIMIIDKVVQQALDDASVTVSSLTLVAATAMPGLPGAVMVGRTFGESLATVLGIPFIPVNHVHGHIASVVVSKPHLSLVVSGGHTSLYRIDGKEITLLEQTLDDAVGEAFDKVARVLGLGYPGGPVVEKLARDWSGEIIQFVKKPNYHIDGFSYSGLKSAVISYLNKHKNFNLGQICHSFQLEAFTQLSYKLKRYFDKSDIKTLCVSGGVAVNKFLQELLESQLGPMGVSVYFPAAELCGDNAAMIAMAALKFH
ncbi:MAG: tRNA (adenosine(37)-N6)-threonylcarbamoyltransferase complex transferase subunit TsaD [Firmicutes bacterium]|nr:tRNA (adenosine(37)-N6)-threonylcarbamoyltransferase complex transferase subunit TsaD [Bacillota bacterium]